MDTINLCCKEHQRTADTHSNKAWMKANLKKCTKENKKLSRQ